MMLALGIDIGGTNTAYGFVDIYGVIHAKGSISTLGHSTVDNFIEALHNELTPYISKFGHGNIAGIGVGAPNGNYYTGEIVFAPNLPWRGVLPLAELFKNIFSSGVATGGIAALILNVVLPETHK